MKVFLISISFFVIFSNAKNLPSYIKACSRNDPNLDECVKKSSNEALVSIIEGDKAYGQFSLSPLTLPFVELRAGNNFVLKYNNLKAYGFNECHIKKVHLDMEKRVATVESSIPKLQFLGDYEIHGKILVLPIDGQGKANVTYLDLFVSMAFHWDLETRKGEEYMKIADMQLDFTLGKATFDLQNLFNGDERLGKETLNLMNENWEAIEKDLHSSVCETMRSVTKQVTMNYCTKTPFKLLFPE